MTNKDKFIEVFGFEPDTETMIPVCPPRGVECPFMDDGIYSECHCELWWGREYKPESRVNNRNDDKELASDLLALAVMCANEGTDNCDIAVTTTIGEINCHIEFERVEDGN